MSAGAATAALRHADGLQAGRYTRADFEALLAGGVGCATVTCGIWEDAAEALDAVAIWRDLIDENDDLAGVARTTDDIDRLNAERRVAIILGFQNSALLQGRIRFVGLFAELGVRVIQLTYNNQNDVGGSCYEPNDSGLTRFGHEVVEEMNRAGMLVDLSHVGDRTSLDAIAASSDPVAVTHGNPASLYDHPRNKSDEVLRALAERGGVIGCSLYPNILGPRWSATLDAWAEMVVRTIDLAGVENVAVGSDLGGIVTDDDLRWMREGRWTRRTHHGAALSAGVGADDPDWFPSMDRFAQLAEGLSRQGLDDAAVGAVLGGNWRRLYREVLR